jgi:ATP-binding cassette subfamily F protein 3
VGKTYGEHNVFHNVNLTIKRGEKVAFVGKNGEGKSTLVKCIMNEIPFDGTLKVGHNIQIGYFAQNQAQLLDENLTVFETIDNVARGEIRLRIKDILGAFMFGGEESDKYVKFLSGGERSRLAMIRLLLEPVNFLILDEPTNHLDMVSKDVLKEAIKAFDGTVIVVSHDREFLDGLVDKVYEFGGGMVREHLGGIYDYLRTKNAQTISEAIDSPLPPLFDRGEQSATTKSKGNTSPLSKRGAGGESRKADKEGVSYAERKAEQKKNNRIEKRRKELEQKIDQLEQRKAELDTLLMQPDNAANMQMVNDYTALQAELDKLEEEYFSL